MSQSNQKPHQEGQKKAKILICDDERANLNLLINILKDDFQVIVARNGREAIERACSDPMPDLILLDIMMPGMNGYDACQHLKRDVKTRDIPVIFITAVSEMMDGTRSFSVGADDFITKPFYPPMVIARVENQLSLHRAYRQLAEQNDSLKQMARMREDIESISRHDLKNPLHAIVGMSDLLMSSDIDDESRDMACMIRDAAYRMSGMINNSLDLIKMEKGQYQTEFKSIDVFRPLQCAIEEITPDLTSKSLQLEVLLNSKPAAKEASVVLMGEELLFYSIFNNLIHNAVESSAEGQLITVSFDAQDTDWEVSIQNVGEVHESIRDRFFEKYVTYGKRNGTGLGTYSSKLMVELMNGRISLDASVPNQTRILLKFPKIDPARIAAD